MKQRIKILVMENDKVGRGPQEETSTEISGVFASAASESAFFYPGGSRTQVYSPTSKWLG